jgi:hypothetical protein
VVGNTLISAEWMIMIVPHIMDITEPLVQEEEVAVEAAELCHLHCMLFFILFSEVSCLTYAKYYTAS